MSELRVTLAAPVGMITLRGDLAAEPLRAICCDLCGTGFPAPLRVENGEGRALAWMSPDEALILLPPAEVASALARIAEALEGTHHLAADVSDARSLFEVEGAALRDVLQRLTPADLSPAAWPSGCLRRTRLAQVAGAIWLEVEGRARVICFRSVTGYVETLLQNAARSGPAGFHDPD